MKRERKVISCILALVLAAGSLFPTAIPSVFATEISSGTCGANLTWTLNSDGKLDISGTGKMEDYTVDFSDSTAPWSRYHEQINAVEINSGAASIGNYAFYNCTGLRSVRMPDGLTSVGASAFESCSALESISIPDTVVRIGDAAFFCCHSLTNAVLGKSVTSIGRYAFYECLQLQYTNIPDGVTEIAPYTYLKCIQLEQISIPDGVRKIGEQAFQYCGRMEFDGIPDSVTTIESLAFEGCEKVEQIALSKNVAEIGAGAFAECSSLDIINVDEENPSYCSKDGLLYNKEQTLLVSCPAGLKGTVSISDGVTALDGWAFAGCKNMIEVNLPDSVKEIGEFAFSWCESLRKISLPEGIDTIHNGMFFGCSSLAGIDLPDTVGRIELNAFSWCSNLTFAHIPDGVTWIGWEAFYRCDNLQDVNYNGTKASWQAMNEENQSDVGEVSLFSSSGNEDAYHVSVTAEDVPGGVAVTMQSENGIIYYTLDGTEPCTASIPYEGTVLLDEEGEYFINARAFSTEQGKCGIISTEYIDLKKSDTVRITEEQETVSFIPSDNVYYTMDLTEEPSTNSYHYTGPISVSDNAVIRARMIESGKAPGDITTYTCYREEGSGLSFPEQSYSFHNESVSFGYEKVGYRIPQERYTEVFGKVMGEFLYDFFGESWSGSCFGMASTVLLFREGLTELADYSDEADTVYDLLPPGSKDNLLTQLIERYQIAQFLPEILEERDDASEGGNMVISGLTGNAAYGEHLLDMIHQACIGKEPAVLILWRRDMAGAHAVVPYRMENGKIYVYDCDFPGEEKYITWQMDTNGTYSFSYGEYSYAISCNTLRTLLIALEGVQENAELSSKAECSAEEDNYMLLSLNSDQFSIFNADGQEVTDYLFCVPVAGEENNVRVLYLPEGQYTVQCGDKSLDQLDISAASQNECYTAEISDPDAAVELGKENGHLSFSVSGDKEVSTDVRVKTAADRENAISIDAEYVKFYSCTDYASLLQTTASSITANGRNLDLIKDKADPDRYFAPVASGFRESQRAVYDDGFACYLRTDITQLMDRACVATVRLHGGKSGDMLFTASYDKNGKQVAIRSAAVEPGKTRYAFTIGGDAEKVKILLLDSQKKPLAENVQLLREEEVPPYKTCSIAYQSSNGIALEKTVSRSKRERRCLFCLNRSAAISHRTYRQLPGMLQHRIPSPLFILLPVSARRRL